MSVKMCAHVLDNGTVCQSPALGEHKHCYFHIRLHQRPTRRKDGTVNLILADLTCVESIHIAISNVLHATNDGLIDSKTANSLYRGLGMALSALRLKLAQQKFEASQNKEDSHSRSYRRDPLSQIISLLQTAPPDTGSRSPSSDTQIADAGSPILSDENLAQGGSPGEQEQNPNHAVILTANEVSRKDPVSAPATLSAPGNSHQQPSCNPTSAPQLANGPMTQSPDGPIPHQVTSSDELTPVLPDHKVKQLRRIVRQGPRHPQFYSAYRLLEKHGAALANARNAQQPGECRDGRPARLTRREKRRALRS